MYSAIVVCAQGQRLGQSLGAQARIEYMLMIDKGSKLFRGVQHTHPERRSLRLTLPVENARSRLVATSARV